MEEVGGGQELASIELFAGVGGLGLGLIQAGFIPRAVVEFNRWCCDTLRENHRVFDNRVGNKTHSWNVVEADIRQVNFSLFEDQLDLVSGGPPCQPFSLGGQHKAYEDTRDMFPEAVRAIREVRPKAFIFENVKGLMRSAFHDYFSYVQLQLEHPELVSKVDEGWQDHLVRLQQHHTSSKRVGLHYNVVTKLLNSANYGVPQKRERVIFVGFRDDVDACWSFDNGAYSQSALIWDQTFGNYWDRHEVAQKNRRIEGRSAQMAKRLSPSEKPEEIPWRTTRDAIGDLPNPQHTRKKGNILNHRYQPGARTYKGHTGSFLDEPSKTLKAGVHGVPGGENMLRHSDGFVRYFTVREAARIQTFPDGFRFHGSWGESMRQLGNAVPSDLARVVGESVANKLR